jgi:hypothetical protein
MQAKKQEQKYYLSLAKILSCSSAVKISRASVANSDNLEISSNLISLPKRASVNSITDLDAWFKVMPLASIWFFPPTKQTKFLSVCSSSNLLSVSQFMFFYKRSKK